MTAFKEDPRDQKLDLGVGVYKDSTGITPIMRSIKLAEKNGGRLKVANHMLAWRRPCVFRRHNFISFG